MKDEALKLALEALEFDGFTPDDATHRHYTIKAITAIKEALTQPEQEPTEAWPCVIETADFEEDTVTLAMQCSNYKVGAGQHWLYTTPPQRPWVDLTEDEIENIEEKALTKQWAIRMALAAVKERNA